MDHSAISAQVAGCIAYAGQSYTWNGNTIPMCAGGAVLSEPSAMFDQGQPGVADLSAPAEHAAFSNGFPKSGQSITAPDGRRLIVVESNCPPGHPAVIITVKMEGK